MNIVDNSITELPVKDTETIRVIQITDTHIVEQGAPLFSDFDTSASLQNVIKHIQQHESASDVLLLTGDCVHEPVQTAYERLAEHLSKITHPLYTIPGNHDDPVLMRYILGQYGFDVGRLVKINQWLLILLDSRLIGEHKGFLEIAELDFLESTLKSNSHLHCLIALHHHPVSIQSSWMDYMMLENANDFLKIVEQYRNVKGIIWGHIHQKFDLIRNNVYLMGSPSTCLQFKAHSDKFELDDKSPAYRKIELLSDGKINTKVVYINR